MPVVGCPKCKKKFKLSNEMLGKTVRCSNCETAFKTASQATSKTTSKADPKSSPPARTKAKTSEAAKQGKQRRAKRPATASGGPTQASKSSLKDVGLSGPINPQMDLFAQPIPSKRGPDPLGNFSLEDPGFGSVDLDVDDEDEADSKPEDKKHLFMNPALKSAVPTSRNRKAKRPSSKPAGFKPINVLGKVVSAFALIGVACCLAMAIIMVISVIQKNTSGAEFENAKYIGGIALIIMIVANSLTYLISIAFWPLAHANTSVLGAQGQKFSPLDDCYLLVCALVEYLFDPNGIHGNSQGKQETCRKEMEEVEGRGLGTFHVADRSIGISNFFLCHDCQQGNDGDGWSMG